MLRVRKEELERGKGEGLTEASSRGVWVRVSAAGTEYQVTIEIKAEVYDGVGS